MFIDVTRPGGSNVRLAASAIAYLDDFRDGCHIHLAGGDYLRVEESRLEVELRARACSAADNDPTAPLIDPDRERLAADVAEANGVMSPAEAMEARADAVRSRPRRDRNR